MEEMKKWYALYTKPRWEKKVDQLLSHKGIESYCPMNKVRRQWSDRVRVVNEPLFKSYVFIRVSEEEKTAARNTSGVLNFVYWLGKPAVVKTVEIDKIKKFLNEYDQVEPVPLGLCPNDKVIIKSGVLMDKEGTVKRILHKQVEVVIESLGYRLIASVEKKRMTVIK